MYLYRKTDPMPLVMSKILIILLHISLFGMTIFKINSNKRHVQKYFNISDMLFNLSYSVIAFCTLSNSN